MRELFEKLTKWKVTRIRHFRAQDIAHSRRITLQREDEATRNARDQRTRSEDLCPQSANVSFLALTAHSAHSAVSMECQVEHVDITCIREVRRCCGASRSRAACDLGGAGAHATNKSGRAPPYRAASVDV